MPPKSKKASKSHATAADFDPTERPCKRTRRSEVTLSEKIDILNWHHSNGKNQSNTAQHFKNVFPTLNQSTVGRWVKNEEELRRQFDSGSKTETIRNRQVKHPEFERALGIWLDQIERQQQSRLSGHAIKAVAKKFYDLLEVPEQDRLELSNGWLSAFSKRHGIKLVKSHGDSVLAPVSNATVGDEQTRMSQLIKRFLEKGHHTLADVFNMDETTLFYAAIPDQILATYFNASAKQSKIRLTLALTVNALGTETLNPLFIGTASRPRCFAKRTGEELGFHYFYNKNAWMTVEIFNMWLQNWNADLVQRNRHILLLVDSFSGHKTDTVTSNIQLEFFAPNVPNFIQPFEAGIVHAFMAIYRRKTVLRTVDRLFRLDIDKDIFKIDQLSAMKLARDAWDDVKAQTIENCWKRAGILPSATGFSDDYSKELDIDTPIEIVEEEVQELQAALDNLRAAVSERKQPLDLVKASEWINVNADEVAGRVLTLEEIVSTVMENEASEEESDEHEYEEAPITDKQALAAILDLEQHSLENGVEIPAEVKRYLDQRRSELRFGMQATLKQKIRNYLAIPS